MKQVKAIKKVSLALVTFEDGDGIEHTTLVVVGDNKAQILNAKALGISNSTAQGLAAEWLSQEILAKLSPTGGTK